MESNALGTVPQDPALEGEWINQIRLITATATATSDNHGKESV
jgi:hypothetical protein